MRDLDYDASAHCAPGEFVSWMYFRTGSGPHRAEKCSGDEFDAAGEAGLFDAPPQVTPSIYSIELSTPMTAGSPYSLALELELYWGEEGSMQAEMWGTNAACGAGSTAVLLETRMLAVDPQVFCFDFLPQSAFTHVLLVARDIDDQYPEGDPRQGMVYSGATFCPAGSCP